MKVPVNCIYCFQKLQCDSIEGVVWGCESECCKININMSYQDNNWMDRRSPIMYVTDNGEDVTDLVVYFRNFKIEFSYQQGVTFVCKNNSHDRIAQMDYVPEVDLLDLASVEKLMHSLLVFS